LFDPALGHEVTADVILRDTMDAGQTAQGPAVITEDETTIVIPASMQALAQPDGTIDVTLKGATS